ncbi:MAG: biosynthetic-type acetolactate synthase large subunit [Oscillospiraceae bacterium]|nr:biosynthetic-type acetolactate synthase large subunit [Oscillospiraceae bacterium]
MKLTGSQILIETLVEQGVTDVFGYPGGQVVNIYDELYQAQDRLRHILTAHEQGAAHAADGYARATGKVGVVIATSGPGATNLVTGIATAMLDSVPMVAITGNVPCSMIGRDSFQEVDITGITLPITKHNYFVNDVDDLADTIREAFRIAKSGRPGPVLVDIPKDVQQAVTDFHVGQAVSPFEEKKAKEKYIDQAVELIRKSERPYIYIGGGVAGRDLGEEIMKLTEKTDAVIGSSFMGLSAVPSDAERFLGMQGMHGHYASSMANKEADLIIGVGVRFSERATGNTAKYAKNTRIIHIDIDPSEINKNISVDLGISGDIGDTLRRITDKLSERKLPQWQNEISRLRAEEKAIAEKARKANGHTLTPEKIFDAINDIKKENTVVATDVGQHQMWAAQYLKFTRNRTFISSGGLGTMGYGLGAAIGAAIGCSERTILVTGDGSFGMNLNELATAVTYDLPITVVLINNGVLGMVRQWQTLFFHKHYSNTVLERKTDFVKLAEAFGAEGVRVTDERGLSDALKAAVNAKGTNIIEVIIDKDEFVLPMLPPGGSIDDIITEKGV